MRKFVQKNSKKIYWLSLLATVLLSYGFLLTQVSVGIDDEAYGNYYGGDSLAAQGRVDRKSTRLNSSHSAKSRMPSSA